MQPNDPRVGKSGQALDDKQADACIVLDINKLQEACKHSEQSLRVMDSGCIAIPITVDIMTCAVYITKVNPHTGYAVVAWHKQWIPYTPHSGKMILQKSDIITKWQGAETVVPRKAMTTKLEIHQKFQCPDNDNTCKIWLGHAVSGELC